jgi:hypothetical protein
LLTDQEPMMSHGALASAANTLGALVSALASLADRDSSLTIWMFQAHWYVGVDTGASIDDGIDLEGPDLAELLHLTLEEVLTLPRAEGGAGASGTTDPEDFTAVLALLEACRDRLTDYPLDLAYIPHSQVAPDAPWEVNFTFKEEQEIWMEATALEALTGPARVIGVIG